VGPRDPDQRANDPHFGINFSTFYPPAPNFVLSGTTFSEGEIFWIVKHGIRNTAMLAWGSLLTDEELWRVAGVVRKFNSTRDSGSPLQTGF